MRIIAGRFKGSRLTAPAGVVARPTTDRVKESMFSLLGVTWSGGTVLDLFAGSGALGLEAVSRGADRAIFVDTSPRSLAAIRDNVDTCVKSDSSDESFAAIWRCDWKSAWRRVEDSNAELGWVFVDPPYAEQLWTPVLEAIGQSDVPVLHGVVCEHPKDHALPPVCGRLVQHKSKTYGDIAVSLYHVGVRNVGFRGDAP